MWIRDGTHSPTTRGDRGHVGPGGTHVVDTCQQSPGGRRVADC